jgi:hypothetical protein
MPLMTQEEAGRASLACEAAFCRYVEVAAKTHRMLSDLSGYVTLDHRVAIIEQRLRENDADKIYMEAREALFGVIARISSTTSLSAQRIGCCCEFEHGPSS